MAKTPTLSRTSVRPLYAVAGATDLAVELARAYVSEAQRSIRSVELKPRSLQARTRTAVTTRVEEITKDARALPGKVESYVNDTVGDLTETYGELATRGERVVGRIRGQQSTQDAVAEVKRTASTAKATKTTAKKSAASTRSRAKATGTTAKKAAAKTAEAVVEGVEKIGD